MNFIEMTCGQKRVTNIVHIVQKVEQIFRFCNEFTCYNGNYLYPSLVVNTQKHTACNEFHKKIVCERISRYVKKKFVVRRKMSNKFV